MIELPKKDLYRVDEVAAILTLSRATVYRYIDEGKLPAVRVGTKCLRVKRKELLKMVETT